MRRSLTDCDALIEEIYAAATAPETWPAVMNRLSAAVGAQSGVFVLSDRTKLEAEMTFTTGVITDKRLQALYAEIYHALDPALPYFSALNPGETAVTSRLWSRKERESTAFYQDYYTKECELFDFLAINLFRDADRSSIIGMQRAVGREEFADADIALMKRLAPHLRRAFEMHRVFVGLAGARDALRDIVDRVPIAAFIVDSGEHVKFANRVAESLIAANDGLSVDRTRRLRMADGTAVAQISAAVRQVSGPVSGDASSLGAKIKVSRPSGRPPLSVSVSRAPMVGTERLALLMVEDSSAAETGTARLMTLYRLTNRELGLLTALLAGTSLKDHCDAAGVTINTGRFHLKSLFAKTGARSQADLIRIALPVIREL